MSFFFVFGWSTLHIIPFLIARYHPHASNTTTLHLSSVSSVLATLSYPVCIFKTFALAFTSGAFDYSVLNTPNRYTLFLLFSTRQYSAHICKNRTTHHTAHETVLRCITVLSYLVPLLGRTWGSVRFSLICARGGYPGAWYIGK